MAPPFQIMNIMRYDPRDRDEVLRRMRILLDRRGRDNAENRNEWADLAGGRVFKIVTADPSKEHNPWALSFAYNDLADIEMIPVFETSRMIQNLEASKMPEGLGSKPWE